MKCSLKGPSRIEIAQEVIDAGLLLCRNYGIEERVQGVPGPVVSYALGSIDLLLITPKTELYSGETPNGLDIWHSEVPGRPRKVFSAWWRDMNGLHLKTISLVRLNRGPWLPALLTAAGLPPID